MGASAWTYFAPYQEDIAEALKALREKVFRDGDYYEPAEFYGEVLESEELPEHLRRDLQGIVWDMGNAPQPETIEELLESSAESGTHSILDIQGISSQPEFGAATPLSPEELLELFGTEQPDHSMVEEQAGDIPGMRDIWQGTYIIVYKEGLPAEIFFAGFSGD